MIKQDHTPRSTVREIRKSLTPAAHLAGSVEETAARLGLGRTTVYALIKDGTLGSIQIGRRRLIPETAVEAFLARLQGIAC